MKVRNQIFESDVMPDISIILPVLNESENLIRAIPQLEKVIKETGCAYEIIIVDDESTDGTEEVLNNLSQNANVMVLDRHWKLGLSSAVVDGFNFARGSVLGVLDADLSHDISIIPDLISTLNNSDIKMVIGSRYIKGGGVDNTWPLKRRIVSRIASLMARPITRVKDPLSGFFFFKKELLNGVKLRTTGFKICLEILIKANCERFKEIPYVFTDRKFGRSKLKTVVVLGYIVQLLDLYLYKLRNHKGA